MAVAIIDLLLFFPLFIFAIEAAGFRRFANSRNILIANELYRLVTGTVHCSIVAQTLISKGWMKRQVRVCTYVRVCKLKWKFSLTLPRFFVAGDKRFSKFCCVKYIRTYMSILAVDSPILFSNVHVCRINSIMSLDRSGRTISCHGYQSVWLALVDSFSELWTTKRRRNGERERDIFVFSDHW